ncbi:DegT/DnrJ/EryC1/StrS aminotransferase [Desulforamulus reducens MI-1]|uniref:DegT/DnrJ/EryC1/StrS aminotransferase n=1 Tax=Desulforamulus reducens (strain ATCC BAA-1160 / DSM 100696 / MI-1) TaxID=349161 RepID=A4J769_DESRM|nr:DegT/DnrJ/EryC1/StrS family aminotransferase [Desulforamulus reducens]ABO50922.1 DegT/DnrJ/EryC1/StrS aminotransferase [Desulforamulus reducens MI-1]
METRSKTVEKFEEAFAQTIGAKYAVAVSNSTAAFHAALYAAGVSHKDEVILSPLVHPELAHAIRYLDGVPIYTDVNAQTGLLDPAAVRWRITANTRAVIATHYAGQPCDMDALAKVTAGKEIVIIEDASQALGASYKGKKIGTVSSLTVFDFSHKQGLYTELGGMVVTDSAEYYHWLTLFRDTGIRRDKTELVKEEGPWHFEAQEIGFNYRMTSMQAEMGLQQLIDIEQVHAGRQEMAEKYLAALAETAGLQLPIQNQDSHGAWYSFPVLLKGEHLIARRKELVEILLQQGIPVDVQYYPIYLHPIYLWQGHPDVCTVEGPLCPRAEDFYRRVVNLPILPYIDKQCIKKIVEIFNKL